MDEHLDYLTNLIQEWTDLFASVPELLTGHGLDPATWSTRFRRDADRIRELELYGLEHLLAGFDQMGITPELVEHGREPEPDPSISSLYPHDSHRRFFLLAYEIWTRASLLRHEHLAAMPPTEPKPAVP
jgi:hypothetical protein